MLADNKLPEIPALAPVDEMPARDLAAQVRVGWGLPSGEIAESEWSWLTPLTAQDAVSTEEPGPVHSALAPQTSMWEEQSATEPLTPPRRAPQRPRRRLVIMGGFFAAAVLVIVAVGVGLASLVDGGDGGSPELVDEPTTEQAQSSAVAAVDPCPDRVQGSTTYGDGTGDQKSGPGAIQAWNHAYYVTRSAREAKSVTTARAVADEPELQKAIDAVAGSTHCLAITERGDGVYAVRLTVTAPQAQPEVIEQLVQTTRAGGRWWIESISKGGA